MLFSGFAESKAKDSTEWPIELPDDATTTMRPLLELMHSKFGSSTPAREQMEHQYVPYLLNVTIFYQLGCADSYIRAATRLAVDVPGSGFGSYWYRPLPPDLAGESSALFQAPFLAVVITRSLIDFF
ncbi:hypothetical protein Micbo1qcDRAFT_181086 [Microdochium bolleyi]|uniref:Uncharacterized protein n=1 Tax=Microdochium bolleyi TaxID=196109 RepID=A0A136IJT4_9PEZI|nr:hypothetical protein Micbo1qcDRAFT_181086 [Microdochium bolleyi]